MARRIRSGTLVGPGICRKWRPAGMGSLEKTIFWANNAAPADPPHDLPVIASMTPPDSQPVRFARKNGRSAAALGERLAREVDGEVLFDAASRGRYATDASIYQVVPLGVVVPRSAEAAIAALEIAAESGVPILPRGAGTSQC